MLQSLQPNDIFLQPGELCVSDAEHRLRTILGSCVAITLWHPGRRLGAMSHFLLADRGAHAAAHPLDARYGREALELMVQRLERMNVDVHACEAKIFGGGNMFPGKGNPAIVSIGSHNGEAARKILAERRILVRHEDLFGNGHRQVIFDIATGDVWVRQVPPPAYREPLIPKDRPRKTFA